MPLLTLCRQSAKQLCHVLATLLISDTRSILRKKPTKGGGRVRGQGQALDEFGDPGDDLIRLIESGQARQSQSNGTSARSLRNRSPCANRSMRSHRSNSLKIAGRRRTRVARTGRRSSARRSFADAAEISRWAYPTTVLGSLDNLRGKEPLPVGHVTVDRAPPANSQWLAQQRLLGPAGTTMLEAIHHSHGRSQCRANAWR